MLIADVFVVSASEREVVLQNSQYITPLTQCWVVLVSCTIHSFIYYTKNRLEVGLIFAM